MSQMGRRYGNDGAHMVRIVLLEGGEIDRGIACLLHGHDWMFVKKSKNHIAGMVTTYYMCKKCFAKHREYEYGGK